MSKNIATPKQTGGGGFTFEDKVSASFLRQMLCGEPVLDAEIGLIECVGFQMRVDGWHLDDVVLRLGAKSGTSRAAFSIKSNAQLSDQGFPLEFTQAIWEQRLHRSTTQFDITQDFLVLVTSPITVDVKKSWESLLRKAVDADLDSFADRLGQPGYANDQERRIFTSLQCPPALDNSKTDREVTALLKRLRHFQFDFESASSVDENTQVVRCRDLLHNGSLQDANTLWGTLKGLARRFATSGGDLQRVQLGELLRSKFTLREYPETASDWTRIATDFRHEIGLVPDSLGGRTVLQRTEIASISIDTSVTALVGTSGTGKSAIARQFAVKVATVGHAVWLTSKTLNSVRPSAILGELGLTHGFLGLISETLVKQGIIVIDGVERLNEQGLGNLCAVLRATLNGGRSAWSVVLTCVVDQWESVLRSIQKKAGSAIAIDVIQIDFSFQKHRKAIEQSFPNLAKVLSRPHFGRLFDNLKVLDVVVSNAGADKAAERWIGETDVIDWYWHEFVTGDGTASRSRLLQKLACKEADEFQDGVAVGDLESTECEVGAELVSLQIVTNRDERFDFVHDMIADWARSRFLLSKECEVASIAREKVVNPRWHRAIRLFGLRLLEDERRGVKRWEELISALSPSGKFTLESDLMLESVIFAADPRQRLQQIWPALLCNGGGQLVRLLTRFLHVGTIPDPHIDLTSSVALAAAWRVPYWPVWPAVVQKLHEQRAEVTPIALRQLTQIAHEWILHTPRDWPLRNEAAQILLDAVGYVIERMNQDGWKFDHDAAEHVFELLPIVAAVHPDDTAELILRLVERRDSSLFAKKNGLADQDIEASPTGDVAGLIDDDEPTCAAPWPEGPRRPINHRVQAGLLSSANPLRHLYAERPDAANEALLALLIREPLLLTASGRRYRGLGRDESLHLETERDWSPPMYFRGPFLAFLRISAAKAIEGIVSLVNFATDRWCENQQQESAPLVINIEGKEREYYGSWEVYYWYRDLPGDSNVLSCALMALEKMLYEVSDEKKNLDWLIQLILQSTRSVALLGVLVACGRRRPELFKTSLRDLVPVWQLQLWEERYRIENLESTLGMTMMQWTRWGESVWNTVREFHTLPHRKLTLGEVLLRQFLTDQDMRVYLREVRIRWSSQLPALAGSEHCDFVERISLQFDENNWQSRQVEDRIEINYVEPDDVTARHSDTRNDLEKRMTLFSFPYRCRKILDEQRCLNADEMSAFWLQIQEFANWQGNDEYEHQKVADAIMGGIAVLYLLHSDWLEAAPDKMSWCVAQFNRILDEPPSTSLPNIAESISSDQWENFAGILAMTLLADDASQPGTRAICADLALAYRFNVLHDVMATAFQHRLRLGDDFRRFQHLVLVACGLREVHIVTHGGNSIWGTPDIPFDLLEQYESLIGRFVNRTLEPVVPSLAVVAESTNTTIFRMLEEQRQKWGQTWNAAVRESIANRVVRCRGFEPHMLQAGFHWLDRIDEAVDLADRASILLTIVDVLQACLRPLGDTAQAVADEDDDERSFYSAPGRVDTWVFEVVARLLPKTVPEDEPDRLWKPILELGLDRDFWVEQFLSTFFIHGLKIAGGEQAFFREWRQMISFAWTCESWQKSPVSGKREREKLFRYLMGFGLGGSFLEDRRFERYVSYMRLDFERWAREFLRYDDSISAFARMLVHPAAEGLRRDGIAWIADAVPRLPESAWDEDYDTANALMTLVESDWAENSALICAESSLRQQLTRIVKTMADLQIARALELQDRMARYGT